MLTEKCSEISGTCTVLSPQTRPETSRCFVKDAAGRVKTYTAGNIPRTCRLSSVITQLETSRHKRCSVPTSRKSNSCFCHQKRGWERPNIWLKNLILSPLIRLKKFRCLIVKRIWLCTTNTEGNTPTSHRQHHC